MALSPTTYPPLLPRHRPSPTQSHSQSPHNQPSHPPLNTPLTYGVIILPQAGELPAATLPGMNGVVTKLDLSMWSGTLNWRQLQTLGPATMAPYPSPTQLLTANANEATTYETINPHTTRGLTGRGTIVELPARIGQMGIIFLFTCCTCRSELL